MSKSAAIQRQHSPSSLNRIIAQLVGVSLVSLGFGLAVVLIGWPLAASIWLAHEGVAWIARAGGEPRLFSEALVSIVSIVAGLLLTACFARVFFQFIRRCVSADRGSGEQHREAPDAPVRGVLGAGAPLAVTVQLDAAVAAGVPRLQMIKQGHAVRFY